jgi:hypothetical protein
MAGLLFEFDFALITKLASRLGGMIRHAWLF